MKVKLLLVPLLISISIALLIWFVYPTYTNGIDGVKEKRAEEKSVAKQLSDIDAKIANVENLFNGMSSLSGEQESIMKYLPESIKEEEVIDNFNYLATSEGLSVIDLSIEQIKKEATTVTTLGGGEQLANQPIDPVTGLPIQEKPKPAAERFKVKFSVIGEYSEIKTLINKLYGLERFSRIASLEVKRPTSSGNENVLGNNLQANLGLELGFYKKLSRVDDLEDPTLLANSFDTSVISEIRSIKNTNILKLQLDSTGKDNPFLP